MGVADCSFHCSTCVAQSIRVMMTCLVPLLPSPTHNGPRLRATVAPESVILSGRTNKKRGFRPLREVKLTSHDTDLRQPCNTCVGCTCSLVNHYVSSSEPE